MVSFESRGNFLFDGEKLTTSDIDYRFACDIVNPDLKVPKKWNIKWLAGANDMSLVYFEGFLWDSNGQLTIRGSFIRDHKFCIIITNSYQNDTCNSLTSHRWYNRFIQCYVQRSVWMKINAIGSQPIKCFEFIECSYKLLANSIAWIV